MCYNIKLRLSKKYCDFRLRGIPYQGSLPRYMHTKINKAYQFCCEQGFAAFPQEEKESDPENTDEEELAELIAEGHHWEEWKYTMVPIPCFKNFAGWARKNKLCMTTPKSMIDKRKAQNRAPSEESVDSPPLLSDIPSPASSTSEGDAA